MDRPDQSLSLDRLLAFAAGRLPAGEAETINAALHATPDAGRLLRRIEAIRDTLRSDDSHEPPPQLVARARRIATDDAEAAARPRWWDRLDVWIASLVYDSRLQATGVRNGGADGDSRFQLTFECEAADVELQASRTTDRESEPWHVMGQVAADLQTGPHRVSIAPSARRDGRHTNHAVRETVTDADGLFELDVEPGTYDMHVEVADRVMVLPGIQMM